MGVNIAGWLLDNVAKSIIANYEKIVIFTLFPIIVGTGLGIFFIQNMRDLLIGVPLIFVAIPLLVGIFEILQDRILEFYRRE
ncbi:MAG: hypothetical protein WC861_05235 [Candidatus Micrarchaeia archaeon]